MNQSNNDVSRFLKELENVLRMQIDGYARLLVALDRKREVIKLAQLDRVGGIAEMELKILERLHELDQRREAVIVDVIRALGIEGQEASVSTICGSLSEEAAARLLALASELRQNIEQARKESSVVRSAGEALSKHMAGVMQSVRGVLASAGIYGNQGQLTGGVARASGLDVSS